MRNLRSFTLLALLLVLSPAARALTPVGAPLTIVEDAPCSFITSLEVTATPKGAVDVVWVDDWTEFVKSQRFARDLHTGGPVTDILLVHGGLNVIQPVGTWAGRYELALNVLDFGEDPSDPEAAYRMSLDLDGVPLAEPARFETPRFLKIAPAAGGDSLQLRFEPPYYGPATCRSRGILASRIGPGGAPLSGESRVTRRASGWSSGYLEVARQPNDTFVAAYSTCEKLTGVVARRLNSSGATVGNPINLPFPAQIGNFGGSRNLLLAVHGNDLVVGAMIYNSQTPEIIGGYTRALRNGKVAAVHRISAPAGLNVGGLIDLEASSTGSSYLLLFRGVTSERQALFAQVLDAQGAPQGAPLLLAENGVNGAIASLPDGRWLAVARVQTGTPDACTESLVGTVLGE
ncbi:MAG: hypothetical protein ABUT39_08680 [Acidobacteriota bacterium]